MDLLPTFLDVREQPCLVVGGGEVAARKCALLLRAGARVTVLAPELSAAFDADLAAGRIAHRAARFRDEDLDGVALAIAATSDEAVNRAVAAAAKARRVPVNVVDRPALCSFILPSIIERAPLVVAVSSGGASPVLARLLRARLESLIPAGYGRLAALAGAFRDRVKARFKPPERRRFWERVLQGPIAELVFSGRDAEAREALRASLEDTRFAFSGGEVSLVGAGPGDPDLLTFRALRLMQQADVVVYDRLVSRPVLDMVRLEAERIYAGKERARHALPQEDINQLLIRLARQGKRVVRLKGGDPFIFGRGSEEADFLARHDVPFEVVPGITAASGCLAALGIPLTHRGVANGVRFVTGHCGSDDELDLNWASLADPDTTLVVYMGLANMHVICTRLVESGLPAETPAVAIAHGTTPKQKICRASVGTLAETLAAAGIAAPALIVIGRVVELADQWARPWALGATAPAAARVSGTDRA